MKVQKSHLRIAMFVLGAAVLYSVFNYLRPAQRVTGPPAPQQPLIAAAPAAAGGGVIDPLAIPAPLDVDVSRAPGFARDPFLFGDETRNVVVAAAVQYRGPDPMVRSILYSSSRRLAIVDGKIVGVGDTVGVYKVAEIEQGAVVFTLAGGERRRVSVYATAPAGLTR